MTRRSPPLGRCGRYLAFVVGSVVLQYLVHCFSLLLLLFALVLSPLACWFTHVSYSTYVTLWYGMCVHVCLFPLLFGLLVKLFVVCA